MSDHSPIMTKVAAGGSAQGQALSGSATGVFSSGIGNFWDLITAQLNAPEDAKWIFAGTPKTGNLKDLVSTQTGTAENAPLLANTNANATLGTANANNNGLAKIKENNPLALLQLALSTQTLDADGNIVVSAAETETADLQTQLDVTDGIISALKNIAPDSTENEGLIGTILGKLQAKSDSLRASLSALENPVITKDTAVEDIPLPLFTALGLTPAEISKIADSIQKLEDKLGREITVEDLIAGVGGLIPAQPTMQAAVTLGTKTDITSGITDATEPTDDLAAQLNALDVGGSEDGLTNKDPSLDQDAAIDEKTSPELNGKTKADAATFKDNLVNTLPAHKAQAGGANAQAPAHILAYFAEETSGDLQPQLGMNAVTSYSAAAQAANIVSSPASAGQAHPATQMVAATLIKAGKNGDDNVMTLRLDPPELGNVSIRLQFGKDKTVKAIISSEKPETHLMLQRDAHALERALQAAGLETGSDALSFQLQDFAHDNNGERGGEQNFGSKATASQDADDVDVIQSTVTWQVDSSTGHVRYNIFA